MTARLAAAALVAVVVVLPLLITAGIHGTVSTVFGPSSPSRAALADIPADYLALYLQATTVCPGLDWAVLAAIGKIESDHGRSPLPGVSSGENAHGAGGPMQILATTWDSVVARHEIPPGGSTPPSRHDPHDAIHVAAAYLCDSGARDGDLRRSIFTYNRADWYVSAVLAQAEQYRATTTTAPGELRTHWPPEAATMPDPTSSGRVTPRTYTLARALFERGLTGDGIACVAPRPANPASGHPAGKACDIFFDPHNPNEIAQGWQLVNWLIAHQATYGIDYLIWQGQFWSADHPRWVPYRSDAYDCPNPANLTGCHYDHVHWSVL